MQSCYLCGKKGTNILYKKGNFNIIKCLNCKFIYVDPIPSKDELYRFYKKFDYKNLEKIEKIIRNDARSSLKLISRFTNKREGLFDVGCGRGFFLDEARKMGWKVYGVDYSSKVTSYAQNVLHLDVQYVDIFDFKSKQKFNVITLNQIIEHLSNPRDLIKRCYELLCPKGIIYIATPNIDSLAARVSKENFDHLIPPEHLGYYNKETLSKLLKQFNFRILYTGSWSYSVDLAGVIKRLLKGRPNNIEISHENIYFDSNIHKISKIKKIKYILFDKLFCGLFYRILNFDSFGTMFEILAIKE